MVRGMQAMIGSDQSQALAATAALAVGGLCLVWSAGRFLSTYLTGFDIWNFELSWAVNSVLLLIGVLLVGSSLMQGLMTLWMLRLSSVGLFGLVLVTGLLQSPIHSAGQLFFSFLHVAVFMGLACFMMLLSFDVEDPREELPWSWSHRAV